MLNTQMIGKQGDIVTVLFSILVPLLFTFFSNFSTFSPLFLLFSLSFFPSLSFFSISKTGQPDSPLLHGWQFFRHCISCIRFPCPYLALLLRKFDKIRSGQSVSGNH